MKRIYWSTRICSPVHPWCRPKSIRLSRDATAELDTVLEMGGAVAAVESGYMKQQLVASLTERRARIESGDDTVVGLNAFELKRAEPVADRG